MLQENMPQDKGLLDNELQHNEAEKIRERGILGAVTLAVAATSVNAYKKPDGLTQGTGDTTSSTSGSYSSSNSIGSVHCYSEAWAQPFTYWEDAYAEAITSAIADLCNYKYWPDYNHDNTYKLVEDFANAYAQVVVEAGANCVSSATGDAEVEGCAFAEASAYAWEYAFVDVHAKAAAEAFGSYCTCDGTDVAAIDWAYGSISQVLETEAFANVDVTACVSGNDYAEAKGHASCWADIYAHAIAESIAVAYVSSSYYYGCYSIVQATALINVESWVYEADECTFIEYAQGLTDVNTGGGATTRSYAN